jgi:ankyrin repeat protein
LLLHHGANLDAIDDKTASTPLHFAASFNRMEAVKALVEHGADLHMRNGEGLTAFQLSNKNRFAEISAFLVTKGNSRTVR